MRPYMGTMQHSYFVLGNNVPMDERARLFASLESRTVSELLLKYLQLGVGDSRGMYPFGDNVSLIITRKSHPDPVVNATQFEYTVQGIQTNGSAQKIFTPVYTPASLSNVPVDVVVSIETELRRLNAEFEDPQSTIEKMSALSDAIESLKKILEIARR